MTSFNSAARRRTAIAYTFLLPPLAVIALFQLYPMLHALGLAFWDYLPGSPNNHFIGLENFTKLAGDKAFWRAMENSFLYLLVVPVIIGLSLALAILVEPRIRFIDFFRACYYAPVVTMMVGVAYAWSLIFNTDNGLLNRLLMSMGTISKGIPWLTSEKLALWTIMTVTIWKGLGYYMVMFIVALKAVQPGLIEAARIDGANAWQVFRHVTVPQLWPTISLVSILSAISALQVFEEIYMMTQGRVRTSTMVYEIYRMGFDMQNAGDLRMGYACAMGVVLFVILFVFTSIAVRSMDRAYRT